MFVMTGFNDNLAFKISKTGASALSFLFLFLFAQNLSHKVQQRHQLIGANSSTYFTPSCYSGARLGLSFHSPLLHFALWLVFSFIIYCCVP